MADNVPYTPGAGAAIAADDIGGVHYQRVKLALGGDGTVEGDVSSDRPLPTLNASETQALMRALEMITDGPHVENSTGRLRVVLDSTGGAQTLTNLTTVSTVNAVSSINAVSNISAATFIYDTIDIAWANCIRSRIS